MFHAWIHENPSHLTYLWSFSNGCMVGLGSSNSTASTAAVSSSVMWPAEFQRFHKMPSWVPKNFTCCLALVVALLSWKMCTFCEFLGVMPVMPPNVPPFSRNLPIHLDSLRVSVCLPYSSPHQPNKRDISRFPWKYIRMVWLPKVSLMFVLFFFMFCFFHGLHPPSSWTTTLPGVLHPYSAKQWRCKWSNSSTISSSLHGWKGYPQKHLNWIQA